MIDAILIKKLITEKEKHNTKLHRNTSSLLENYIKENKFQIIENFTHISQP